LRPTDKPWGVRHFYVRDPFGTPHSWMPFARANARPSLTCDNLCNGV